MPGGRAGAYATVRLMRRLVDDAVTDPAMLNLAVSIINFAPHMDQLAEVDALFGYVLGHIKYVRDIAGVETIADPRTTAARRVGDCDDKATLLATLFEAVGYPTRFVMAGYKSESQFEHVYLSVLVNGTWLDADATVFEGLGYAPPDAKILWHERG